MPLPAPRVMPLTQFLDENWFNLYTYSVLTEVIVPFLPYCDAFLLTVYRCRSSELGALMCVSFMCGNRN